MQSLLPKKRDVLNFFNDKDDPDLVAKDAVAMYIHLSLAMLYADEINSTLIKYHIIMGFVKGEYKKLDKAMRDYDHAFRELIIDEPRMLEGYDDVHQALLKYTDDNAETFASLFQNIHGAVDKYIGENFAANRDNLEERIDEHTTK